MLNYVFAFFAGGAITIAITYFETSGFPTISRLAALFPIFTWLSYLFIGKLSGAEAVSRHALFVLFGTIVAWLPYMFMIYFFAPKIGATKSVFLGIIVFIVLALIFIKFYKI
ncbi:MAG: GlpM family protein [Candidatus Giovannonibacteria bacterium]|nr:GlpM family protein [Candidatus Giovannonibacteria bacterium]